MISGRAATIAKAAPASLSGVSNETPYKTLGGAALRAAVGLRGE